MAKSLTGSGSKDGKKSRLKKLAKEMFFPDAKSYISLASHANDEGKLIEFFEHQADAICFGMHYLLSNGVAVEGAGARLEPDVPQG